jgi:hypothetical protein
MYLIKACPLCKTKLRFPIDKGTIRIKCSCGYDFIANPDNTAIYDNAVFDLSYSRCALKKMSRFTRAMEGIRLNQIVPALITTAFELKYKLQNFRLLPDVEKKKIILVFAIVCCIIAALVITLLFMVQIFKSTEKIVI